MALDVSRIENCARRAIDVIGSAAGLCLLALPMAGIAAAIKLISPGPVFFTQERVGKDNKPFQLIKFRSMRPSEGVNAAQVTAGGDPRVTKIGAFLRKWKLDELPQLINVLKGEMSLVGPRPEVPRYAQHWTQQQSAVILSVRPGITDPVTVTLRDEESLLALQKDPERFYIEQLLPEKAERYVNYVRGRSLFGDIGTIFSTLKAVALR